MKKIRITLFILTVAMVGYLFRTTIKGFKKFGKDALTSTELWETRLAHKKFGSATGLRKADSPDEYVKFYNLIRTKYGETSPQYSQNYKLNELKIAKSRLEKNISSRRAGLNWIARGPGNVPGRTRTLLIMPNDPSGNIWLAGSAGGGIWKTTDAGQSWVNKTPELPNLATTTLAISSSNPNVIYAGTGESFAAGIAGDGIFKSTDGGNTWIQLSSTLSNVDFGHINRIVVDPNNSNIVLAATSGSTGDFASGIFRSTNGGNSWNKVYSSDARIGQLVPSPDDFNTIYATRFAFGVIKSTDAGITWSNAGAGMQPNGRVEMAVSPVDPNRLYASTQGSLTKSGQNSDLYISDNGGELWSLVIEENNGINRDFLGGQGSYDNTIIAHPYDKDIVYFGGVNLWKATIKSGESAPQPTLLSVDQINTQNFLSLVRFGADYNGGTIDKGSSPLSEHVSVEIRFGAGIKQKAHRFTVGNKGSGVPDTGYSYEDYVEVPFQVWDIDNNKQLMVSFRDQNEDGKFELIEQNTDGAPSTHSREYVYVNNVEYSETPDSHIAKKGGASTGHQYKSLYFFWPVLAAGGTWNPANLPSATFRINFGAVVKRFRKTESVTDAYSAFGGTNSFSQTTGSSTTEGIHPDHHGLYIKKVDEVNKTFRIFNTNDGGVYYSKISDNPGVTDGDWVFAGSGYNTSQFYGIGKKPGADEYIGGMQDNGTWKTQTGEVSSSASNFVRQLGADGFEVLWHNIDSNKILASSQFNNIARTLDGGETWLVGTNGLEDIEEGKGPFITKLSNSKSNPDRVFAIGKQGVWRSENFGESWELSRLQNDFTLASNSQVKVSIANPQVVWAGTGMTASDKLHVSTDGGKTFSAVENYTGTTLGSITDLATHPINDQIAYAIFSISGTSKILRTTDLGQTWNDITGFSGGTSTNGFPDVAVYSLLVMPHNPNTIWAGTEIGIVESKNNGASWALINDNLPQTAIWDMKVQDGQVIVATHGRGIWTVSIPELPNPIIVPHINKVGIALNQDILLDATFNSAYDSTVVLIDGVKVGKLDVFPIGNVNINVFGFAKTNGTVKLQLVSYVGGRPYVSNEKSLVLFEVGSTIANYGNNFNRASEDFEGVGFATFTATGFVNGAIHSKHNYDQLTEYTYTLKMPVTVASANATFIYDDVAILEKGDAGTSFGDQKFWDYVIVEGSLDGINWVAIADGYDASYDSKWLEVYDEKGKGKASMYKRHTINLLDTFAPGNVVFFRFRLFSDPLTVGWGWAIDNVHIQEAANDPLGIEDDDIDSKVVSLKVYPNPNASGLLNVDYFLPESGKVNFEIINTAGKVVKSIRSFRNVIGKERKVIELGGLRKGIYFVRMQTIHNSKTTKIVIE